MAINFLTQFLKPTLFAIGILLSFSHCWMNPLTHPPIECLMKLENFLCPDNDNLRKYSIGVYLYFLPESRVTISNLTNHSIVETGFVVGTAPTDVSFVNVGIDDAQPTKVPVINGTWRYALPAKAVTGSFWTYGSQHSIYAHIPFEKSNTILVRKGTNKDTDGDGYPDLIVSATRVNTDTGYVFVYKSNPSAKLLESTPSTSITDGVTSTYFGSQVSSGDFNGDGYADILVGSQAYAGITAFGGRVFLFYSSGTSGVLSKNLNLGGVADSILSGITNGGRLGSLIKGSDINHDGYDDAILASPWNDDVFIFYSQGSNGIPTQDTSTANLTYKPTANDNFGTYLSFGDLNGDGFIDLAVGAGTYSSNLGRIYLYISNFGTLPNQPQQYLIPNANEPSPGCGNLGGCRFGTSFVMDYFNSDQCIDIAVGGPGFNNNQGIVFVYHSTCDPLNPYPNPPVATLLGQPTTSCSGNSCQFGGNIASGDINGDGLVDLMVGATGASLGIGDVNVILNNSNIGIRNLNLSSSEFADSLFSGFATGSNFSQGLRFQDTNADGLQDIVISEPTTTNLVYTFHSIRGSLPANQNLNNSLVTSQTITPPPANGFGNSIAIWKTKAKDYMLAFSYRVKRYLGFI
ncbi:FG-GAP-like repeat-containing protein [Leptospira sp. WS39.C2]